MTAQRVIKRYANRKLYDTQHSKYVTLDQIADMIRRGDDVRIVDNKSKQDLTSVTLAQIIFEEEKKQRSFLPLQAMRNIIQNGSNFVSKAQERVSGMLPLIQKEAEDGEPVPFDKIAGGDEPARTGHLKELREWLMMTQRVIDDWQQKAEQLRNNVARGISPLGSVQTDVEQLATRIADLEAKLRRLGQGDSAMDIDEPAEAQKSTPTENV